MSRSASPAAPPAGLPALELLSCCACGPRTGLDPGAAQRLAAVLKALADPTRLRLVSLIAADPGNEACVCELTDPVGLSQPTVSHHLRILVDAGLLTREQRGKWAYYRLVPDTLNAVAAALTVPAPPAAPATSATAAAGGD